MVEVDKNDQTCRKVEVCLRIKDNAVYGKYHNRLKIHKSNKFSIRINRKILALTYHLSIVFQHEHYLFILYEFYSSYKKKTGMKISDSRASRKNSSERNRDKTVLNCLSLYTETMLFNRKYIQRQILLQSLG